MALVTRKTGGESMAKKTFKDKFQRFETKYIISKETLADLLTEFEGHLVEDEHAY